MLVLKFGGTSVGSAERIRKLYDISLNQRQNNEPIVIVVSAIAGTTDLLFNDKEDVIKVHNQILNELNLDRDLLNDYYERIKNITPTTPKLLDQLLSNGELMSSAIVSAYFTSKGKENTRLTGWEAGIVTDSNFNNAEVLPETYQNISKNITNGIYIVTGFIAKDKQGNVTTLGRGGSDYTAAIVGAALNAREIQVWTDVNGMMSTDPNIVSDAMALDQVSYEEAGELAYFGAKVLHPRTIQPARDKNIPVRILNSLNPSDHGTVIKKTNGLHGIIRAIAYKEGITTIRICSSRMLGAQGFLAKIFEVFARNGISVDMVTTSEVTVSVTVDNNKNLNQTVKELEEFSRVYVNNDRAIICVVGQGMANNSEMPGRILTCLANNNIHVGMISQGASSINISCIIAEKDTKKAVQVLHGLIK